MAVVPSLLSRLSSGKMAKHSWQNALNPWLLFGVDNPSTITVKLSPSGRWTVSMLVDVEIEPLPASPNKIGIDLGITSLIALSNGDKVSNPKS